MIGGKALDFLTPPEGVRIDLQRCLHRRFARTGCQRCAQACPSAAVAMEAEGPRIDRSLCTSCRRCEAACPTGSVEGDERGIGAIAVALAENPKPVLGCRMPGVQAHTRTGCLGFLEKEGLLTLALLFPEGVTLNLTRCEGCHNSGIVQEIEAAAEYLLKLPGGFVGDRIRLVRSCKDLDYREAALSRRAFFTFLGKRSTQAASLAAARLRTAAEPGEGGSKALPARRRLLLRALPLLSSEIGAQLEARLFPSLTFGPSCAGCTGCTGICPTGALSTSAADPPRPVFNPRFCIACGACIEFCRRGGILPKR